MRLCQQAQGGSGQTTLASSKRVYLSHVQWKRDAGQLLQVGLQESLGVVFPDLLARHGLTSQRIRFWLCAVAGLRQA